MSGREDDLDALALELGNDDYPLPGEEKKDRKQVSYKNVDVTISFRKESGKDAEIDEKRILYTDTGFEFDHLLFDEARKVLKVPIVLAKEMIYHYDDYDAFRPRAELEAVAPFVKGVPVTRGHPGAKIVTDRSEVLGWMTSSEYEDDELRGVLEITDKSLIEDIQSGKLKGVSPGHFSRLDKTSDGEFEGSHYDVVQRDIFVDHIAIVEKGRCSTEDGCGIMLDEEVKNKKKKEEGDEEEIMEPKVVANKVEAAINVAEKIEKKAEEEKTVLEEIVKLEEVPSAVIAKVKKAIGIAEKISEETKAKLKVNLEKVKEAVTGMKEEEGDEEKKKETDAIAEEAIEKIEAERDVLKAELDEIVAEEKTKLIDELGTLQEVKTEEQLKEMSLDSLKSDLELVKALKGSKVTFDDKDRAEAGSGAIAKAYKGVGRQGGKGRWTQ